MPTRASITTIIVLLFAMALTGCFNDPPPLGSLLLAPNDFPTEGVREIAKISAATSKDEPAVQVELTAPGFTILESLVLFETRERALSTLAGIDEDHGALRMVSDSAAGFDDSSGIIVEHLDGEQASTVFFVEGRALVKVTVTGDNEVASVWEIARRAREKVEG